MPTIAAVIAAMREHPRESDILDDELMITDALHDNQTELPDCTITNSRQMEDFLRGTVWDKLKISNIPRRYAYAIRSRAYHMRTDIEPPIAEIICNRQDGLVDVNHSAED